MGDLRSCVRPEVVGERTNARTSYRPDCRPTLIRVVYIYCRVFIYGLRAQVNERKKLPKDGSEILELVAAAKATLNRSVRSARKERCTYRRRTSFAIEYFRIPRSSEELHFAVANYFVDHI